MYLLEGACKDYLWGGTLLRERFGKGADLAVVAESWELSTHPDGLTMLPCGESLRDYLAAHPAAGGACVNAEGDLPLLVKLIDAQKPLSVQVHPDDAYAARVGQRGKTELWHVLEATEDAYLYLGVNQEISCEELECRIAENTVEDILKRVPVKAGESYYIPAGTLHAIGAGCLIYEVQQSSNLTYRVYDYGRVGADGKPRQLHIEDALAVSTLSFVDTTPPQQNKDDGTIVCCPYFTLRELNVDGKVEVSAPENSFCHLLCVCGEMTAEQEAECAALTAGAGLFLAAGESVTVKGCGRLLAVSAGES